MDYKRYDIVIMPPPDIAAQAVAVSRALVPRETFFVLDDQELHPHISLYHVPLRAEQLPMVIAALQTLAASTEPFVLQQATYYPDQGVWVGVRYVADQAILNLHTAVIAATKEARVIEDDARYKARWSDMTPKERENLKSCGWAHAYTLYLPHLTFTKLTQPQSDVWAHLPQPDFSFRADHIGLYELGENGTCTRLVADFWLEKKSAEE